MRLPSTIDDVTAELQAIAERLADQALDRLRQAADDPDGRESLLAEERRISRARRAVEKAAAILAESSSEVD